MHESKTILCLQAFADRETVIKRVTALAKYQQHIEDHLEPIVPKKAQRKAATGRRRPNNLVGGSRSLEKEENLNSTIETVHSEKVKPGVKEKVRCIVELLPLKDAFLSTKVLVKSRFMRDTASSAKKVIELKCGVSFENITSIVNISGYVNETPREKDASAVDRRRNAAHVEGAQTSFSAIEQLQSHIERTTSHAIGRGDYLVHLFTTHFDAALEGLSDSFARAQR